MSIKKKIISCAAALALAVTSAVSFTGCADVSYVMTVDGETIPAGVYIMYSGYALDDAEALLAEEQPDLDTSAEGFDYYAQTVGGMSFGDYVKQETVNYCKRYVAINRLFDELGIGFDTAEQETINDNINAQWNYSVSDWSSYLSYLKGFGTLGDYYQSIGVGKSSYREVMLAGAKSSEIFDYYYGEGGVQEVSREEIETYIAENYALVRYFGISLNDEDNKLIEDEAQLKALEELANGYAEELNNGVSYSEVYEEYQDYLKKDDEEDESGNEETEENEEAEENEEGEENEEAEENEEGEESEEAEENEEGEESEEAEESSEEEEEEHDHEHDDSQYDRIINVESTSPSEEFVEALFKQKTGTATVFKADSYYYVVQRLDITESEKYVDDYKDTALSALKGDELDGVYEEKYAGYSMTENTSVPDYARQQASNARQGLTTISAIQYYSYLSSLYSY